MTICLVKLAKLSDYTRLFLKTCHFSVSHQRAKAALWWIIN